MNHLVWFGEAIHWKESARSGTGCCSFNSKWGWWFQSKTRVGVSAWMLKIWAFVHILVCTESYVDMEWWILCVCQKQRLFFLWSLSEWSVCSSNCLSAPNTHTHMLYFVCWNSSVSVHPFASHYPIALPLSHTHTHTHTHTLFFLVSVCLHSFLRLLLFSSDQLWPVWHLLFCVRLSANDTWNPSRDRQTRTQTQTHTHTDTHTQTDTHTHTDTRTQTQTHTHTDTHTQTDAHTRSFEKYYIWMTLYLFYKKCIYLL